MVSTTTYRSRDHWMTSWAPQGLYHFPYKTQKRFQISNLRLPTASPPPNHKPTTTMSQPGSRAPSREPSKSRHTDDAPQHQSHRGRSRSRRTHRSPSVNSTISDDNDSPSSASQPPNPNHHRKRRNKKRNPALPVVDEIDDTGRQVANTAQNAVSTVGDTAGAVVGGGSSEKGSDKPLKLRLDLNLDADIRLTAKVHGDVTLSLL